MALVDGSESTWIGNVILSVIYFLIAIYLVNKCKLIKGNKISINDRMHTFTLYIISFAIGHAIGAIYHKVYGWQDVTILSNDTSITSKILCCLNYLGVCILPFMLSLIVQPTWLLSPDYNRLNERKSWTIWICISFVINMVVSYILQLLYDNLIGTAVSYLLFIILLIISSMLNSLRLKNEYLSRFVYVYMMTLFVWIIMMIVWTIYRAPCVFEYINCPFNKYFSFYTVLHLLLFMETMLIWYGIVCEQRAIKMYQELPQEEIETEDDDGNTII